MTKDEEQIQKLKQHDRQAFAYFYELFKVPIYRYCLKMLADTAAAEDAVHETFLKMHLNIHQLQSAETFQSWLFRIARNEVLMHFRRNRRNGESVSEEIWDDHTPYEAALKTETCEIVQHLLGRLKHEYREVLLFREYEQLSYAEIASITGNSESSVKSRIFKARNALTAKLKRYYQ